MRERHRRRGGRGVLLIMTLAVIAVFAVSFGPGIYAYFSGAGETPWNLTLVNGEHQVPEDWECSLTELMNGQAVDSRCYPDLQAMMDACRASGCSPYICSSYRTQAMQQELFDEQVAEVMARGSSESEAAETAATSVAVPGTSEHQLGLAVDIVNDDGGPYGYGDAQAWLAENSWRYGFILRYPEGKTEITGIIYEPWHFRYVGGEAAGEIYRQGVTLEEYLGK